MDLSREEILSELEKILQSRSLQGSENLKSFLRYAVEKAADGEETQLREYTIATEVFGRSQDYDSRTDSVVRVQAGRLRTKLGEYYAGEGASDPVIIDLPKGQYLPVFTRRPVVTEPTSPPPPVATWEPPGAIPPVVPEERLPPPPPAGRGRGFWLKSLVAALTIISLALLLLLIEFRSQAKQLRNSLGARQSNVVAEGTQMYSPLWEEFFKSPEPILVAYSNTIFQGTAEKGMRLLNSLNATAHHQQQQASGYGAAAPTEAKGGVTISDHYTGVGEVMGVYFLGNLFWKVNQPFRVKRSLLLTWDDVKTGNIVVLGSPAENFLLRDLPQQQDFVFKVLNDDPENPLYGIANLRPRPGEQDVYIAKEEGPSSSQVAEDYALVSLLKGLDDKHRLLILAGIKTYGTQAAAEYVTRPENLKELVEHLKEKGQDGSATLPAYFQVLLKVKVNGGVPVQTTYVTHHVLN